MNIGSNKLYESQKIDNESQMSSGAKYGSKRLRAKRVWYHYIYLSICSWYLLVYYCLGWFIILMGFGWL